MRKEEIEDIEINLLLQGIYSRYGHDFRNYARGSVKRRILNFMAKVDQKTVSGLISLVLHDEAFFEKFVRELSITVSEMFRDPEFFKLLRNQVIPYLKTHPFIKIWHAGCATGEEVHSLAIVLKEEGFYERSTIFATDFNDSALMNAREGIYPMERMQEFTANYQRSGGTGPFAGYYRAAYGAAIFDPSLRKNIVFANHNLATDGVFSEMHLVVCRNVLIYFDRNLQNRTLKLFRDSLAHGGVLALGSKEDLQFSEVAGDFKILDAKWKIYQKTSI
ncbi:putative methyltransferase Cher3 [Syntrophobacter sp. SbD1]|nr:putative methyltransferase Cher3 [Syntrophobacter sp. SbD1]